jgi:hypothetical protein
MRDPRSRDAGSIPAWVTAIKYSSHVVKSGDTRRLERRARSGRASSTLALATHNWSDAPANMRPRSLVLHLQPRGAARCDVERQRSPDAGASDRGTLLQMSWRSTDSHKVGCLVRFQDLQLKHGRVRKQAKRRGREPRVCGFDAHLGYSLIPWSNGKDAWPTSRKVMVRFHPGSLNKTTGL